MGLDREEWEGADSEVATARKQLGYASKNVSDLRGILEQGHEETGEAWLKTNLDRIDALPSIDTIHGKLGTVETDIKANEPPKIMLTAAEKSGALTSISYVEPHVGYIASYTERVPTMATKVASLTSELAALKTEVEEDPPTPRHRARPRGTHRTLRHHSASPRATAPTSSRRGLTPRQRRRG